MSGLRCGQCKNKLLQKSDAGVKLRTKGAIIFLEDGTCQAQCYWCGTSANLPIQLNAEVPDQPVRYVISKGIDRAE